ncbi:MAG: hypothetical protein JW797_16220 [Bradymonadales bacterium]|nr:hypothetical protein [Bradymonadales bacterium]
MAEEGDAGLDAIGDQDEEEPVDPNSCAFSGDGICDEPANCPLGTDSVDCIQACASGQNLHLFAAACAYRDPVESPPDDSRPSGGDFHRTGDLDRTLTVPSGYAPSSLEVVRHYRLFVPSSYDPARAVPLVVVLPGHRVDIYSLADYTQLNSSAELNRFIVVYAEQQWRRDGRWAWWTDWDWEDRGDQNPDLVFLRAIIAAVADDYNIDLGRVFLVGHSRGAAMAFIAALKLQETVAGGCSQSGFTEFGYRDTLAGWTDRHVPLFFIHGVEDRDVCIDCSAGGTCGAVPGQPCHTADASDTLVQTLVDLGWIVDDELVYRRLENVAHRWQPQLNQEWWGFLSSRPLEVEPR